MRYLNLNFGCYGSDSNQQLDEDIQVQPAVGVV